MSAPEAIDRLLDEATPREQKAFAEGTAAARRETHSGVELDPDQLRELTEITLNSLRDRLTRARLELEQAAGEYEPIHPDRQRLRAHAVDLLDQVGVAHTLSGALIRLVDAHPGQRR